MFNTYYAICVYKELKAGSMYALNKGYALNNEVRLTTRIYGKGNRNESGLLQDDVFEDGCNSGELDCELDHEGIALVDHSLVPRLSESLVKLAMRMHLISRGFMGVSTCPHYVVYVWRPVPLS